MSSLISQLLKRPENEFCADCHKRTPAWASSNIGVFICIECSGIHRSLGSHISFVRSCTLDSWTTEQANFMASVGNKIANEYWEAKIPSDFKRPEPTNSFEMTNFIRQKYVQRQWVSDVLPQPSLTQVQQPHIEIKKVCQKPKTISTPKENQIQDMSANDVSIDDLFGEERQNRQRIQKKVAPKAPTSVSSSARKPGQKIPERLLRKMKNKQ